MAEICRGFAPKAAKAFREWEWGYPVLAMSRVVRTFRVPVRLVPCRRGRSRRSVRELDIPVARVDFKGGRLNVFFGCLNGWHVYGLR